MDWVEGNIRYVSEKSGGRLAYVHVPDTANGGHTMFKRYFYPQSQRAGLILDERFNRGGQIADYYIDIMRRPVIAHWKMRYGGDLISELREVNPNAQALVLSASLDHEGLARAVESGASATLDKTAHLDEIVLALRRLSAGETLLPLDEVVELLRFAGRRREREHEDREAISHLTDREREVLQALADGLDSQGVADSLGISVRTARNHVASILGKLGVHSQLQALIFALRYDVVAIR